jgi:CubicO group peptidase (beta-lactamase class C family)
MSSGLDCDDWTPGSPGNEEIMYGRPDWVDFILDLPMRASPGAIGSYCTGGVVVLGYIIEYRTGMNLDAYADTYLLAPLGIREVRWRRAPDGHATGGGGLWLRPRDAAKLGQLYLDGGRWNGAQVVPAAWVERSRLQSLRLGQDGYGLLWWKRRIPFNGGAHDSFFTSGNGGNYVFVLPGLDMVVVFTGSNYNSALGDQPFAILSQRLFPAIR